MIRHWIERDRRRIRAEVIGDFTLDEIVAVINAAVRDPEYEPGFDVLSDHSAVGEPLTRAQAEDVSHHLEKLSLYMAGTRWAVVTTRPASFGMIRMLSVLAESVPMSIEAFRTLAEAETWLATPADPETERGRR